MTAPPAVPAGRLSPADLRAADSNALRAELAAALTLTASHLSYLAAVWAELERRGEDLAGLRRGMGVYLAAIAAGRLLAEVVVLYAGEPLTLKRVAALPVAGQRAVVAGEARPPGPRRPARGTGPAPRPERAPALPSAAEVDAEIRRPARPADPPAGYDRGAPPDPVAASARGSPGDVASLILRMIAASSDPAAVARRLAPELDRFINPPSGRTPCRGTG